MRETMFCPSCGHSNAAEARFCGSCGAVLPDDVSTGRPAPATPLPVTGPYAGFWMRFAAFIIDNLVVLLIFVVFRWVFVFGGPIGAWGSLVSTVLGPLYYVLMTGLQGQTIGKMALGVKVVRADGMPPGLGYAALREIVGKFVSSLVLLLRFLWIAWDPKKRGWHDYIAGTVVVNVR